MGTKRKRGEGRGVGLRIEMLEERRLLSGGLSLLASPLPSLLLRLTPSEVAAVLQQGQVSLGVTAANPGSGTANAVANANVGGNAGANLAVNVNLLQPGGNLLAVRASGWGSSGMGTVVNFGARATVNPTQGTSGDGSSQLDIGTLFDFSKELGVDLGGQEGIGFGEEGRMFLPGAETINGSGIAGLGIPDVSTTGPSSRDAPNTPLSAATGFESPTEITPSQDTQTAGSDGKSLDPQTDDLQDASSSFGSLDRLFQNLLDQMDDLGHRLSNWLGQVSWASWSIGIALVAVACAGIHRKWRRGHGHEASPATSEATVETWWFPGLR